MGEGCFNTFDIMRIKNIISNIRTIRKPLLWGGLVGLLISCSNIPEDERLIYVEPAKAARNVLIEDFTGQKCVNCPKASDAIHEIQSVYGDNVIAVAIHCGPFGVAPSARNIGLMTETGKEYWNTWGLEGQPNAKINRGLPTNDYNNWISEVAKCLEAQTDVTISAVVDYDKATGKGAVNVLTSANAGRKAKIQVWLTEDNIVALQSMPDGSTNREYQHNHVFRAAVNGAWGEDIVYGETAMNYECDFTININDTSINKWTPENMHVVVFVYDNNGVEQVIQVPVINN